MTRALLLLALLSACARGGEYASRSSDRPTLFDRVAHDFGRAFGPRQRGGHVHATDLALLPDGLLLVGSFGPGDLVFDPDDGPTQALESRGQSDGFLARLGRDGAARQVRAFGGPGVERITAATADPEGRTALAMSLFDAARQDIDGQPVSVHGDPGAAIALLGPTGEARATLAIDTDGYVVVTGMAAFQHERGPAVVAAGMFQGTVRVADQVFTSEGASDILLLCLSFDGQLLWAQREGGAGSDTVLDIAARGDRLVIGGAFTDRARIGDRDLVSMARPGRFRRPAQDAFVASMASQSGALLWLQVIAGPGSESTVAVTMGPGDRAYAAGVMERFARIKLRTLESPGQGDDLFLLSLDEGGGIAWSRTLGGPGRDHPAAVSALADGVALIGSFEQELPVDAYRLASAGGHDLFALATTRDGTTRWARRFGGPGQDAASAMVTTPGPDHAQALIATGTFTAQADLGGDAPLVAPAGQSGFLIRFH